MYIIHSLVVVEVEVVVVVVVKVKSVRTYLEVALKRLNFASVSSFLGSCTVVARLRTKRSHSALVRVAGAFLSPWSLYSMYI